MRFLSLFLIALLAACHSVEDSSLPQLGRAPAQDWPHCVDGNAASADGLTPEDFNYEQWPVTNVMLRAVEPKDHLPNDISLVYVADISPDTPEANQPKQADPVGITLAWVKLELYKTFDNGTQWKIDETSNDHHKGKVVGYGHSIDLPDDGSAINVVLKATPYFYYLNKDGGARLDYATSECNTGYFVGRGELSNSYSVSQDDNGNIVVIEADRPGSFGASVVMLSGGREIIASKLFVADVNGMYITDNSRDLDIGDGLVANRVQRFYKWNKGIIRLKRKGSSGSFADHWSFGDDDITLYIVSGGRNIAFGPTTTRANYGNFAIRNQNEWSHVTDIGDGDLFGVVIARED